MCTFPGPGLCLCAPGWPCPQRDTVRVHGSLQGPSDHTRLPCSVPLHRRPATLPPGLRSRHSPTISPVLSGLPSCPWAWTARRWFFLNYKIHIT